MSQAAQILAHLRSGRSITQLEALRIYGCLRLGARIFDLRQEGLRIEREMVADGATGKRYASYRLAA
jgi:hypothetical protein